jgi:hypothetical protein
MNAPAPSEKATEARQCLVLAEICRNMLDELAALLDPSSSLRFIENFNTRNSRVINDRFKREVQFPLR